MIKAVIFDFAGVIGVDGYWVWLRENVPNIEEERPASIHYSIKNAV